MLSTFLVQREFSRMHVTRKPLRVSEPRGIQRSSFFISLPLRYGIPLYATSGLMHWLISQSLFLARITAIKPDGTIDAKNSFSTCGASPIAVVISKFYLGLAIPQTKFSIAIYSNTCGIDHPPVYGGTRLSEIWRNDENRGNQQPSYQRRVPCPWRGSDEWIYVARNVGRRWETKRKG